MTKADLVERLRDIRFGDAVNVAVECDDLCQEAADEIERLRAQYDADLSSVRWLYETDSAELRRIRKGIRHVKWFVRRVFA